jgi:hypothetical protein
MAGAAAQQRGVQAPWRRQTSNGEIFWSQETGRISEEFLGVFFFSESEDGETVVLKIWDLIIFGFETA